MSQDKNQDNKNNSEEEMPEMGCDCSHCPLSCGEVVDSFEEEYEEDEENNKD